MATKRDGLRIWWSKFEQIDHLASCLGKTTVTLIEEYLAAAPVHSQRDRQPLGFEEYVMSRAASERPDLLRDHTRCFFELFDATALMEGEKELRSRLCWLRMAPLVSPLAGTETVAGIVFDELVKGTDSATMLCVSRFEEYVQALFKVEAATNETQHWEVVKSQCGLSPGEKCVLYTAYAADCTQFPPAVGALYLTANTVVFQDTVLHNRRIISLHSVPADTLSVADSDGRLALPMV